MFEASQRFLIELLEGPVPHSARLIDMLEVLQDIYESTPVAEPTVWNGQTPDKDFQKYFMLIGQRFPELGYYPSASPSDPMSDKSSLGDAIDDLTDIAGELQEAVWLHENVSPQEANWHFRFSYETHWGEHLRNVLTYLKSGKFDLIW